MRENRELADQARRVAMLARPLGADRGAISRDGHDRDRAQLALARQGELLLQHVDDGGDLCVRWSVRNGVREGMYVLFRPGSVFGHFLNSHEPR